MKIIKNAHDNDMMHMTFIKLKSRYLQYWLRSQLKHVNKITLPFQIHIPYMNLKKKQKKIWSTRFVLPTAPCISSSCALPPPAPSPPLDLIPMDLFEPMECLPMGQLNTLLLTIFSILSKYEAEQSGGSNQTVKLFGKIKSLTVRFEYL